MKLGSVASIVVFYCLCSGSMLVLNKLAVYHVGAPALVTVLQFATSALAVSIGWCIGLVTLDQFQLWRLGHFAIYVLAFSAGTWSNLKVLQHAPVETVIVFRSCAPLFVSVTDYVFYNRALPSLRSMAAMALIVIGTVLYVSVEALGQNKSGDTGVVAGAAQIYLWVCVWFSLLIFQLTYGKTLVTALGLNSIWSPVLYTNSLAIMPTSILGAIAGELVTLSTIEWTAPACAWLTLSCVAGLGISWAGFRCQQVITATAYTVVGVMNKLLTVLLNLLLSPDHASWQGIGALAICLVGGTLYQQSPLRNPPPAVERSQTRTKLLEASLEPSLTSASGPEHCPVDALKRDPRRLGAARV